jgi:transposase
MFKKQRRTVQGELWVHTEDLPVPASNRFYDALTAVFDSIGFDEAVRDLFRPFYRPDGPGHPGVDPAVYIKMLLIGFFENIKSERGIEARCADSLMLRNFLGFAITERVPDHTTLGVIRRRVPKDAFEKAFALLLPVLAQMGLVRAAHIGLDTSVIEANASMRNLRNRISGEKYRIYVKKLAKEAGVDPKDEAAVSRFDRKRKGRKTSNDEWENPHDPDAKIGPTKHGDTRMIYKPEHTVDMETGAMVDAKVLPGDTADSTNVSERIAAAEQRAIAMLPMDELPVETATMDKGYFSAKEVARIELSGIGANMPDRCTNRNLENLTEEEFLAVRRCHARVKSKAGKELLRKRGMHIERSFAHILDCGGMRRTTLRGIENIQKRYSIAALGYNVSLLMLAFIGVGTPKQCAAGARKPVFPSFFRLVVYEVWIFCSDAFGARIRATTVIAC